MKVIKIYKIFFIIYSIIAAIPTLFMFGFVLPVRIFVPQTFIYKSRKIADTVYPSLQGYVALAIILFFFFLLIWYILKKIESNKSREK